MVCQCRQWQLWYPPPGSRYYHLETCYEIYQIGGLRHRQTLRSLILQLRLSGKKIAQLRRLFYLSDPLLSTKAGSPSRGLGTGSTQFENLNLVDAFEKAYADLIKALSEGGNEWIGFSEQLSNVLQTANQLISTAQKETRPLVDRIRSLQALVERGQSALAIAETRMSQTSHS